MVPSFGWIATGVVERRPASQQDIINATRVVLFF